MSVLQVLVALIVVGVILWLVNTYIPMDAVIKRIFTIVVIILVCLWLLSVVGLLPSLSNTRIGR
jgi:hypothetical protein